MKSRKKTVILVLVEGGDSVRCKKAVPFQGLRGNVCLGHYNSLELENNATVGIMPGIDREQRLKELQNELDKGLIAFSINTSPLFDPKTQEGNLMLENPKNNAKLLVAQVVLNEGQKTLYTSKAIQPGSYLERIRLEQPLAEVICRLALADVKWNVRRHDNRDDGRFHMSHQFDLLASRSFNYNVAAAAVAVGA